MVILTQQTILMKELRGNGKTSDSEQSGKQIKCHPSCAVRLDVRYAKASDAVRSQLLISVFEFNLLSHSCYQALIIIFRACKPMAIIKSRYNDSNITIITSSKFLKIK